MAQQYDFQQTFYPSVADVGTKFQLRPQGPWQIATVEIDNPTGRWVYIEPLSLYVPPYTIGWKKESRPWTVSLECTWAEAPAGGGVNVDDGTQLIVTLHSTYLGEDNGLTYKIATDTDKIVTAIENLREGWGTAVLQDGLRGTIGVVNSERDEVTIAIPADDRAKTILRIDVFASAIQVTNLAMQASIRTYAFFGGESYIASHWLNIPNAMSGRIPFIPFWLGDTDFYVGVELIDSPPVNFVVNFTYWYQYV